MTTTSAAANSLINFRRKGFDLARQMFARAIVIDSPICARLRRRSGLLLVSSTCTGTAAKTTSMKPKPPAAKALELDPELAEAHAAGGLAFALKRDFPRARKEFEEAIRLNPKLYEAFYFYARTAFQSGELHKAAELYEQAAKLNPDDYQAVSLLVGVYHGLGRPTDAAAAEKRALQLVQKYHEAHPEDARALYLGAVTLARVGESEKSYDWGYPCPRHRPRRNFHSL